MVHNGFIFVHKQPLKTKSTLVTPRRQIKPVRIKTNLLFLYKVSGVQVRVTVKLVVQHGETGNTLTKHVDDFYQCHLLVRGMRGHHRRPKRDRIGLSYRSKSAFYLRVKHHLFRTTIVIYKQLKPTISCSPRFMCKSLF